jgi:hypothetical protein
MAAAAKMAAAGGNRSGESIIMKMALAAKWRQRGEESKTA